MMKELTGQAHGFLGTKKPFSAVSDWIERLCTQKYAEDEFDGIPELVEAINLQATGPAEASRSIRKKLKYSNVHGQKRALFILKALVENCGTRFQTTFANDQLVERIKITSQDPLVDASVRKLLMRVLLSWRNQFQHDPSMRVVAGLYAACGGGTKSDAQKKSEAAEAFKKQQDKQTTEAQIRSDRKAAEQLQKLQEKEAKAREKARKKTNVSKRPVFNFEQEKQQISQTLATTHQVATALVNALQHVNREKESVSANARVQDYLAKVKNERKNVIRYVQLVKDEEYLGSLISANDQIILALELYDKLAKPIDVDSDDDEPLTAISSTTEEKVAAKIQADDAEIEIVRKRIAEARFNAPETEIEKLQYRQRHRIQRHNSRVDSIRNFDTGTSNNGAFLGVGTGAGSSSGVMGDLMDLNFDDNQPNTPTAGGDHASRGLTASESVAHGFQHGALSDYSDYEESDESDENSHRQHPASGPSSRPRGNAWSNLDNSDEEEWLQATKNHQPKIGPGSGWNEDEEGEQDPFADPFADSNSGSGYTIERPKNQPRKEWTAV